jgi:endo-1,4-beta-xylanase
MANHSAIQGLNAPTTVNLWGLTPLSEAGLGPVNVRSYQGRNYLHVTGRTANWHSVELAFAPPQLRVGDWITVRGRVAGTPPSGAQMALNVNMGGWSTLATQDITSVDQVFTLQRQLTQADINNPAFTSAIRIMTNEGGASMDFSIYDIIVSGSQPNLTFLPPANSAGVIYDLNTDPCVLGLNLNATTMLNNHEFLVRSGTPTITITQHQGTRSLRLSNRTAEWHALDITMDALRAGDIITITGRADGTVPAGTTMILGGGQSPWPWLSTAGVTGTNRAFMLEHIVTEADLNDFESLRIQTNATGASMAYFIDGLTITRGAMPPTWDLSLPSLARTFESQFLVGNIWSSANIMNQTGTANAFLHHFNAVTAENHHKPDHIAPNPNPATWNFTTADQIVDWAEQNNLHMIGHTLVWHSQSPLWLTGRSGHSTLPLVNRQQAIANMELYISTVAGRYQGRIFSWDVVNEVFVDSISLSDWNSNPNWRNHLRREGRGLSNPTYNRWYDAFANGASGNQSGSDFIYYAFRMARLTDPNAILYYNDFNEEQPGKREAIAQMVEQINERWRQDPGYDGRLLIEVIGMQSHYHLDQWATNFNDVRTAMQRFISTGARISITELDITVGTQANPSTPMTAVQQARQAAAYERMFGYYLEFADYINRVSFWGKADNHSWRSWGSPLLFDNQFNAKEAFHAIIRTGIGR